MEFITDRARDDVAALNSKGTYNFSDLNRVIANCNAIVQELNDAGIPITISWTRQTYTDVIIPSLDDEMTEYLSNVNAIKAAIPNNAPSAPESMRYLTFEGANNIEKILQEIDMLINNMLSIFPRSGSAISGAIIYGVNT